MVGGVVPAPSGLHLHQVGRLRLVARARPGSRPPQRGAEARYFEEEAVWLCARCEDVGSRNGRKLAHMAEDGKLLVHKISAEHSSKSARKQTSQAFDGLRPVVHLVRGCKVMITRNVAYRYGLANGTRGKLVGVVYGPGGVGSFPEAIVVDVPEYCGPAFYLSEPKWVPLLPIFSSKKAS